MADALTLSGSAEHVRARLDAYHAAGLTGVMLNPSPPGGWFPLYEGHFPVDAELPPFDYPAFLRVVDDTLELLGALSCSRSGEQRMSLSMPHRRLQDARRWLGRAGVATSSIAVVPFEIRDRVAPTGSAARGPPTAPGFEVSEIGIFPAQSGRRGGVDKYPWPEGASPSSRDQLDARRQTCAGRSPVDLGAFAAPSPPYDAEVAGLARGLENG